MSFREDALKERIEAVRPKIAKAREIAELAETEHREMTAEEKKSFDEFMAEGQKCRRRDEAKRHDDSVLAFAKELSGVALCGLPALQEGQEGVCP